MYKLAIIPFVLLACGQPQKQQAQSKGRLYISHPSLTMKEGETVDVALTNTGKAEVVILALKTEGAFSADTEWELPFSVEAGEKETLQIKAGKGTGDGAVTLTFRDSKDGPQKTQRLALQRQQLVASECVSHNPCREVFVDADGVCQERTKTDGSCNDGNRATHKDRCVGGNCVGLRSDGSAVPDSPSALRTDPAKALQKSARLGGSK